MGFKFLDLVFNQTNLRGAARLVMLALANYADKDGFAFPSIPTLSRKAGLSGRHTQRVIRDLTRRGDLAVEEGRGRHRTNRYRVTVCQGDSLSGVTSETKGVTSDPPGGDTGVTQTVIEPSEEPSDHRRLDPPRNEPAWDQFWAAYPKKVAKQAAMKVWNKVNPSDELVERMLQRLECQKPTPQWQEKAGRFIPHPATWLSERRWEDEDPTETGMREGPKSSSSTCNYHTNGLRCELPFCFRVGRSVRCRWHHYLDNHVGTIIATFEGFQEWLDTTQPFKTKKTPAELWTMANRAAGISE